MKLQTFVFMWLLFFSYLFQLSETHVLRQGNVIVEGLCNYELITATRIALGRLTVLFL